MAQKTLSELTTITEMGEEDMFLIESEGKMKRLSKSIDDVCVIDLRNNSVPGQIDDTAIYNKLLKALDDGKTIFAHLVNSNSPSFHYTMFLDFSYINLVNSGSIYIYIAIIDTYFYPTPGYSPSDLYQPVNLIPDPLIIIIPGGDVI